MVRARLHKALDSISGSYWFIPAVMTLCAAVLALTLTWLDLTGHTGWLQSLGILGASQPDGARELLSAVAGSMITVAGVAFSITIAALAYASSQFGPRLLTNFMNDRGNQVTLGTFIAAFLYCLLVLRTIRDDTDGVDAFVPQLATLCGLGFAVAGVIVLIYFIHHVPESIQVSNVAARIGRELRGHIERHYPPRGAGSQPAAELPPAFARDPRTVCARGDGYVHNIDREGLLKLASRRDLTIEVLVRPGDFVVEGQPLLRAWPPALVTAEATSALEATIAWSGRRVPFEDLRFLVEELVEIAARALSTGVNDPITARTCVDWLAAGVAALGRRDPRAAMCMDAAGRPRLLLPVVDLPELISHAFGYLRPYVAADRNAALHTMETLAGLLDQVDPPAARAALFACAAELRTAARAALPLPADHDTLDQHFRTLSRRYALGQPQA